MGLFTVFELLEKGVRPTSICVVAEHLPGDYSINYASPYAGAYFSPTVPMSWIKFIKYSYENLPRLKTFLGTVDVGLGNIVLDEHVKDDLDELLITALREFAPDLDVAKSSILGCVKHIKMNIYNFNPPKLLDAMVAKYTSLGVTITRKKVSSLEECFQANTVAVFNCSGLGAYKLANDHNVFPTRGQVVVIKAPHIKKVLAVFRLNSATYAIPRPDSTGEVVLGGYYQPHNGDPTVYGYETDDILTRATQTFPEILLENATGNSIKDLQILRVAAAARPSRKPDVRVERENTPKGPVLHNYGATGSGWTCGLGMAHESVSQLFNTLKL